MEITFLGTGSNHPSPTRNVSCLSLRIEGDVWLFDCGEATQIQLMRSTVKAGKITKIFITHLHGDHLFGLPGLMCTIGQNIVDNKTVEIYGPVGLRRFIRVALELSRSMVTYNYIVHELVPLEEQIPEDVKKWKVTETDNDLHPSETRGRQIEADKNGCWSLFENELVTVKSSWIKHRIPCFGFVIEQKPMQGKLDAEGLLAHGIKPGPLYKKIKSGEDIKLDDGKILEASKFIGPSKPGKKLTILGDCCECPKGIIDLAQNSDLVIHEATVENSLEEKALSYGHSTPRNLLILSIAAEVANKINAKYLILNHFSQRYKPVDFFKEKSQDEKEKLKDQMLPEDEDEDNVQKLVDEVKLVYKGPVQAAYDFFSFKV